MAFIKTVSVACAFALLCGCSQIANRAAAVLAPSVTVTEIPIDAAGLITPDAALVFVIKRLNMTQYGAVLEDMFSRGAKPFDYVDLHVKLQERTTQDMLQAERIYIVELINRCDYPDAGGMREFYAKQYFFTSLEEAQQVCAALLALGVRRCCDEGCDEEPPVTE